jgi:lysophospholipase L1-like esterase
LALVFGLIAGFEAPGATCTTAPAGMVGWWPGDGDSTDLASTNNGILHSGATATATGIVAQAFSFDGTNGYVQVPDSPVLHPTNLTVETWVRFDSLDSAGSGASPAGDQYLVFKQNSRSSGFEGFDLSKTRVTGGDVFRFLVSSASGLSVELHSVTQVATGVWYHVAGVRGSNFTQVYVNGQLERQTNVTFAQNYTNSPLYFGTSGQSSWDHKLKGRLDEVSLYNRDLAASEINAIYAAGTNGKCKPPKPATITAQPQSQTDPAGTNALFTLAASGTAPLSYQWLRNGVALTNGGNVSGAAGPSLMVANVQTNDDGNYMAVVTNVAGAATSTVAVLTVFVPPPTFPWETSDIGAVWSDNFDRAALGTNWVILGNANATIVSNQLQFAQNNLDVTRQVYYQPWLLCSDSWTLRWTEQFAVLNSGSLGVGLGLKNFQAASGSDDRGWNALLSGAGASLGKMQIERFDGSVQNLTASGPALAVAAGDVVDCWLTRSGWTMTAMASNRANGQVSLVWTNFSHTNNLPAPSISRICCYPLGGTTYVDDVSYTIKHRKPARFILIGASTMEGYNATAVSRRAINIMQTNFVEAVCNDSSSWNSTSNAVSALPEILAHQPYTAILEIGGNDILYGYPASQWQTNYANLVGQLQANGVRVKHCLGPPRTPTDVRPLKDWISTNYPPGDLIDLWTPMVTGAFSLQTAYDDGDGVHLNDAGQLLLAQIIVSNLPPGIWIQPQTQTAPAGSNVNFTVTATSERPPLTYHWFFNGTNALSDGGKVSGSATTALTISNALGADAGAYWVVVGNPAGNTTGWPPALLTVNDPIITNQPVSQTNVAGTTALFSVGAYGTAPAYQWLKDGAPLIDATNVTLTLSAISGTDAASYSVVVSNSYGNPTSGPAVLVVVPAPQIGSVLVSNAVISLTWNSLAGQKYRLQYKQDLSDPVWQDIPPDVIATGNTLTATNALGGSPQGFYRVFLVP